MSIAAHTVRNAKGIKSRARSEYYYDSEGIDAAAGSNTYPLQLFADFSRFSNSNLALKKVKPRDTNITGQGAMVPQGWEFYWTAWHLKVRAMNVAVTSTTNAGEFGDEVRQWREMAAWQFEFSGNPVIKGQCDEVPSSVGYGFASSTQSGVTVWPYSWGVPHKSNRYNVSTLGKTEALRSLEQFNLQILMPTVVTPTTVAWYVCAVLEGTLLKPFTG